MYRRIQLILIAALALGLVAAASAQQHAELLPAAAGDLTAVEIVAPFAAKTGPDVPREAVAVAPPAAHPGPDVPREAVAVAWPLASDAAVEPAVTPFVSRSREYWVEVTAAELGRGVPVYAESPGALVRLNPAPSLSEPDPRGLEKAAIDPLDLVLVDRQGRAWSAGEGMEQLVGAEQLARTELPFAAGTSAFRLRSELGAGAFELRAASLEGPRRYVMHVLDAASTVELAIKTHRPSYLHGQTLVVEASLVRGEKRFNLRQIDGFVTSPAGRVWPIEFRRARGGVYRASLELDALEPPAPGLWEVHVSAQSRVAGQPVLRGARTAFACAVPSAAFSGEVQWRRDPRGALVVSFAVDAAAAGRYEVRGVLFGTAADGTLKPAGAAQSAAWLEAGAGVLELEFSRRVFEAHALAAPFEVRDLRLGDQGRMGVLHHQARGVVVK